MQEVTTEVEQRAQALQGLGLKAVDALHPACAEASGADVFVTCDAAFPDAIRGISRSSCRRSAQVNSRRYAMRTRVPSDQEIWRDAMQILLAQMSPAKAIRDYKHVSRKHPQ